MALSAGGVKIAVDLILKAAAKAFKAKDVKDADAAVAQMIRDLMQKAPNLVQAAATNGHAESMNCRIQRIKRRVCISQLI